MARIHSRTDFNTEAVFERVALRLRELKHQVLVFGGAVGILYRHIDLREYSEIVETALGIKHRELIQRIVRLQ